MKWVLDAKPLQKLAKAGELHRKENPDLTEDDVIEIAVSFDCTWSK